MTLRPVLAGAAFLASLALPGAAAAADGYSTADVNMRAGPSTAYPVIATIYAGEPVEIYGCLSGWSWCDTGWDGWRGWVAGNYLQAIYESQAVYLPTYAPRIGLPVISFEFATYWDSHYHSRPWYRDRDRWYSYWRDHRDDRREVREDRRERQEDRAERREDRREVREDRGERREDRADRRDDRQQDARQERRQDRRQEVRQDRRQEQRQEVRQERRQEQRQEVRQERRQEQRQDVRQERRQERRPAVRQERRQEQRQERRQERRNDGDNCRTRKNGEVVCR